jgi:phosphoribosylformylglycinamidine cyclo-ligase
VFAKYLAARYPESYDHAVDSGLVYAGSYRLTETIEESGIDAGKLVLSPTRTYAPVIRRILNEMRPAIHGMVHCSGGAQTKVLHFVDHLHVIKDNMFDTPPLFRIIQEQSGTSWREMYRVFNMGHRMELYLDRENAARVIEIAGGFGIEAKIIGRCEAAEGKKLTISSSCGVFEY